MHKRVRKLLALFFYYSGLVGCVLWWMQRRGSRLIILNYHQAAGENLYKQMRYLRRHYRVMHLDDALEEFYAPAQETHGKRGRRKRDKRIPLVLTFDDGYLDNYTDGLQVASKLQIPITIFLTPSYSESGDCFWWLAGAYLMAHTEMVQVKVDGCDYNLANAVERNALAQVIDVRTRYARSVTERESFLSTMQQILHVSLPNRTVEGMNDPSLPLSWSEIHEMERSGWVSFGGHTLHHPILNYLSDISEVWGEVNECRFVLEKQLGHPIRTFAYPIGKMEHIGTTGINAVKAAGYKWGLTTIEEINTPQTDPYLLRRLPGDITLHWSVMASELVGLLGFLSRFRKKHARISK